MECDKDRKNPVNQAFFIPPFALSIETFQHIGQDLKQSMVQPYTVKSGEYRICIPFLAKDRIWGFSCANKL